MQNRIILSAMAGLMCGTALCATTPVAPRKAGTPHPLPADYESFFQRKEISVIPSNPLERPILRKAASPLTASNPEVLGFLYYFQGDNLSQGLYEVKENPRFLWSDYYTANWSMPMTGGWLRDGKLCGLSQMRMMGGLLAYAQIEFDLTSGEILDFHQLTVSDEVTNIYLTTAYRDTDDRVYGYGHIYDGSAYGFKSADATDIDTSVAICEVPYEDICVALCYNRQDDCFYGVTTAGWFVSVSPSGEQRKIANLRLNNLSSTITGLTYSPADNGYLFNAYYDDGASSMLLIDPKGTPDLLYDFTYGEEFIFMLTNGSHSPSGAPEGVEKMSIDFVTSSLSGDIKVKMPSRNMEGTAINGTLDWKLYIDGAIYSEGKGNAGAEVTIPVNSLENGEHVFSILAGNSEGWSDPLTLRKWIGADSPAAPTGVTLTHEKATWEAPVTSAHDGYVDYSAITYDVTLNGEKVTTTAATECEITLPEGKPYTTYSVEVTAIADGMRSAPGVSNFITYGDPLVIPEGGSLHYRPEEYEFPLFDAIDIDGKTDNTGLSRNWHFSETMGFPSFASGADGEDLLVFPPILFDNTKKAYSFEMEAGLISDIDDTGTIEVLLGTEPNPESMTHTIIPATRLYHMRGVIMTGFFSVTEPGPYYIGVLTHTNNVAFHISDMDIKLTDRDADVPMTVSDLSATAGQKGALYADVTFTMPTVTVNGTPLPTDKELTATVTSREYVLDKPYEGKQIGTTTVTGKPGERITTTVETQQNYNTIGVSVAYGNGVGVETTTSLFTGVVLPATVTDFKATVTEDNMGVLLSWNPPTEGEEEGEIGDTFFYSIWYYNDGWEFFDGAGWDTTEALIQLDPENPQTILMIGVMALNAAGQSNSIAATSVIVGKPYTLPMEEHLDDDGYETYDPIAIQRPDDSYNDTYWMLTDPRDVASLFANESGWAYIGYIGTPGVTSAKSRLSLPKFSTEKCGDITFTLTYWGGPYEASLSLLSSVYGADEPVMIGDFEHGKGWMSRSFNLPASLEGLKWVQLYLDSKFPAEQSFAMFSGYSISAGSGVMDVESSEGRIFTTPGMLHVSGHTGESLTVADLDGKVLIRVASLEDLAGFALAPGTYAVSAGNESKVVRIR